MSFFFIFDPIYIMYIPGQTWTNFKNPGQSWTNVDNLGRRFSGTVLIYKEIIRLRLCETYVIKIKL